MFESREDDVCEAHIQSFVLRPGFSQGNTKGRGTSINPTVLIGLRGGSELVKVEEYLLALSAD